MFYFLSKQYFFKAQESLDRVLLLLLNVVNDDFSSDFTVHEFWQGGSFLRRAKFQNRNRGRVSQLKRRPTRLLCNLSFDEENIFVVQGARNRSKKPTTQEAARHRFQVLIIP